MPKHNQNNTVIVEVKSEMTGKSVITFESNDRQKARQEAIDRIANFIGLPRAIASLNYFVEIS